ncbi:MAG: exodeoxyribonuclease VII small subunit [Bacteroidota bacterium]
MAKKTMSYEAAMQEIEEIVGKIENEELDVDMLARNVKRVSELLKFCKTKLKKTSEEVNQILQDIDGDDEDFE